MERLEIKTASVLVLCNYFTNVDNLDREGAEEDYTKAIALFKDEFKFEHFLEKLLNDSNLEFDDRENLFKETNVDGLSYICWSHTQMRQIITHWIKQENNFDTFILIISSHGTNASQQSVIFGENELHLSVSDILGLIEENSTFAATQTPKLVFLQACRGEKYIEVANINLLGESGKDRGDTPDPKATTSAQQEGKTITEHTKEQQSFSVHPKSKSSLSTHSEENPNDVQNAGDKLRNVQLETQPLSTNKQQHTEQRTKHMTTPNVSGHDMTNPSMALLLQTSSKKLDEPLKLPNETLIMFATPFDHVAPRDRTYGSPMLYLFYKFLEEWKQSTTIHNINIIKILTKVIGQYAKDDGDFDGMYAAVLQHNLTKTPFL